MMLVILCGWRPRTQEELHANALPPPTACCRRAVASISIEASPEQVWEVLTDYEALPEFVPNLALCERLPVPPELRSRLVRLRQACTSGVCLLSDRHTSVGLKAYRPHAAHVSRPCMCRPCTWVYGTYCLPACVFCGSIK